VAKNQKLNQEFEELQVELEEAVAQLSEAFLQGSGGDISGLTAKVRACEQAIGDAYYRRWSLP
jgi:hypothetical protein